jgi:ATP adenylyltransferase
VKTLRIFLLGLAIVLLIVFVAQNLPALNQAASLRFITFETPPVPLWVLLCICLALGAAAVWFPATVSRRRMKKSMKGLQQRQARTEAELNSLRNLPITSDSLPGGGAEAGQAG